MTEMSEIRRPAPAMLDHVGVGGMLDNDILGIDETRLQEVTPGVALGETSDQSETGLQNPDEFISRVTTSTCIGQLLIVMKELCRDSGLDEIVTAEMVGQVATDLCDKKPGGDSGLDEIVTAEMVGQMAIDLSDKTGGDFPI